MSEHREKPCKQPRLPEKLAAITDGYRWARDTVGEAGALVYRLHGNSGAPDLYLKRGKADVARDLALEAERLGWLERYLPVPRIIDFLITQDEAFLLMTALPGQTAWQRLEAGPQDRPAIIDALASFLRCLHAVPVEHCPFSNDHVARLADARRRIDAGMVDEADFDDERQGWTAEQVWSALQQRLPLAVEPVVTHGDFSLDNILMHGNEVVGCIDVGRVGIADRYQDLAILWNNLAEFDPALQDRLFGSYGITEPDRSRLDFHLLLDELF